MLLIDVLITLGRVTTVVTVPKPDKAANGQQLITSSSPRSRPVAIITKWVPMSLLRSSRKSCADDHLQSFNVVYGACDLHLLEKTMFKAFTQTWLCHVLPTELGLPNSSGRTVRQLVSSFQSETNIITLFERTRTTRITEQVTHGLKKRFCSLFCRRL